MNKRKAQKLLSSVQDSYVRAIKCFERADYFSRAGQTTKALDKRDEAFVNIRKAEAAKDELDAMIEVAA
jgi:hypothetical protein